MNPMSIVSSSYNRGRTRTQAQVIELPELDNLLESLEAYDSQASALELEGHRISQMPDSIEMSARVFSGESELTGRGVTVAILDSGVAQHPDFRGRLRSSVSVLPQTSEDVDHSGHGTHVAGIVAGDGHLSNGAVMGIAPQADILSVKVLKDSGRSNEHSDVAAIVDGLEWILRHKEQHNIRVANLSFGCAGTGEPERDAILFAPLKQAIRSVVDAGIVVVAASGNDASKVNFNTFPGNMKEVITVGALDINQTPDDPSDDFVTEFSSQGRTPDGLAKPDIYAPGVDILSLNSPESELSRLSKNSHEMLVQTWSGKREFLELQTKRLIESGSWPDSALSLDTETLRRRLYAALLKNIGDVQRSDRTEMFRNDSAYLCMRGTSMAAPIVAGVVALMLEANPILKPSEVKQILRGSSRPIQGAIAASSGALEASASIRAAVQG